MKNIFYYMIFQFIFISFSFMQCDSNNDGELNVIDILIQVDCILEDCWEPNVSCTDYDGNNYETVIIGNQEWMAENLRTTHYNNGDAIPTGLSNSDWANTSSGAYSDYDNNPTNSETYGRLYNWYTKDDYRGVCPIDWHVPTDEEYKELEMFLGMSQSEADDIGWRGANEGSKLAGYASLWPDGSLENSAEFSTSGFNGVPSGYRTSNGGYSNLGYYGSFWSSSESTSNTSWYRLLGYTNSDITRFYINKSSGYSVRCVRSVE
jgi:uncharacterized protein (TIGR02145 family)